MFVAADWRRLYWWVVLQWAVGVALAGACAQRCDCLPKLLTVNCSSRQLSVVPENLPENVLTLQLSHNQLRTLPRRQFSGLTQLQELDLSDNLLGAVEAEAFLGLRKLITLRLSRNRLKILPAGAFAGLPDLQVMDLSENELLVLLDDTLGELRSLRTLEAGKNDLVFVAARAFAGLRTLTELDLSGSNLTAVPAEALSGLSGLVRLDLSGLGLSTLPNNSFRRLVRLRELRVTGCPSLASLSPNSLIGLNLTSLDLSRCNLSSVPHAPLHHLVYLRFLDLSHNPISRIGSHLLGDLLRLQELHLSGGELLRVEPGAVRGLAFLRLLDLSHNRLVTLEESALRSAGALRVLRLDGNPLACDCRLLWLTRGHLGLGSDGTCSSPLRMQGRRLRDFGEAESASLFTCRQARILSRKPQDVRTDEGHTVLFFCEADGDPAPAMSWLSPRRSLITGAGRVRVLPNGTLEVRYAQVQDGGYYRCVASNAAGNDSVTVSLWVRGFSARTRFGLPSSNASQPFPFDVKTLAIAITMGFLSFLSSVAVCFVFMFLWSQGKGQIKHTATIDFVPRTSAPARCAGAGRSGLETGRFTMKLM